MGKLKLTYKLTLAAEQDLVEIYLYGKEQWGKDKASEFIKSIYNRFEWLSTQPEIGRRRDELYPSCRSFAYNKYVILYRITEHVEIVTIVHGSKDIPAHLSELDKLD